jgi:hypothetical protein
MPILTTRDRVLASLAGAAFTAGALIILIGPAVTTPTLWTQYHVLTVLAVLGTIFAGHQITTAWRARSVACLGYLVVFLMGTALVVYNSVGNQVEKTGASIATAEATNEQIASKKADIARAKDRLAYAQRQIERESTGQKCGTRCRGWQQSARDIEAVIENHERALAQLGPQRPVNAKANHMAEVAALFGGDRAKIEAMLTLIEPFLWTLFLEIGSIVSFGFAFRHSAKPALANPATVKLSGKSSGTDLPSDDELDTIRERFFASDVPANRPANVLPFPPKDPGPKGGRKVRTDRKAEVLADIQSRTDNGERFESQSKLAAEYGLPTSTLSDWLKQEPIIRRTVEGRRKRVG